VRSEPADSADFNSGPICLVLSSTVRTEILRGTTNLHDPRRPPFWRDALALAVAVLLLWALVAVARALGID